MPDRRPNLLVLMADQLTARALRAYGGSVARTPHIDALAAGGVVFDSFYCNSPLCAPSRFSFLAGQLPSNIGAYDNAAEFPATVPTFAHYVRSAGYQTALAGKMHFCGPDQLHGFEERLTTDIYPADVDWTPDWERPLDQPLPWYHTMESVLTPGVCAASMQTDYDAEVSFQATRKLYEIARHRPDQPFLLFASFTNPHDPWEIPARHWRRYRRDAIPAPDVGSLPLADADPHSRRLRAMSRVDEAALTVEQIARARHAYFAAVSYLDERVGEVLAALRDSGLQERTTVLFCADHGEMLGERGLWYKMSFHEPSARVPLIVRSPDGAARRVAQPVSLADVAPTIRELASLPAEGASLAAAVTGAGPAPDRPVVSEYHGEGVQAPAAMIRSGDHKLIVSLQDPDLLYDLRADPRELRDLAGDPAHDAVRARLRGQLDARLDLRDVDRRVRASQRERHLVSAALARGRPTPWDHEPRMDASRQYVRNRDDMYELQRRARLDVGDPDALTQ
jgi:choline-sulfatase